MSDLSLSDLKIFLDEKVVQYNKPLFIESDPIQIPHRFQLIQDVEIAGFLTATIAWGNRKSILKSAVNMMELLGESPYDFVRNHSPQDLKSLQKFVHRTFNGADLISFLSGLKGIYQTHSSLEELFGHSESLQMGIHQFKKVFFSFPHDPRSEKHISDPLKKSAAKRINMFLRWMVRPNDTGVDLGIWRQITPAELSCPLDVHSGRVARKLGLLSRKQNDALAVAELDQSLRRLDPLDPVKYDFALFGLGVFEKF
jgi:uncharacterized protein (TIGR02757 family)